MVEGVCLLGLYLSLPWELCVGNLIKIPTYEKQKTEKNTRQRKKITRITIRVGSGRWTGSNKTWLHKAQQISHLKTSSIININRNPPNTQSPHPCNSSSCPQARRPTKTVHSFSFLIVTPLVNMFVRFLDPQIFSNITNLSLTR